MVESSRSDPDPSLLTTDQLRREIFNLDRFFTARIDAMDKAGVVFSDSLTRVPTDTDKQISHLRELVMSLLSKVEEVTAEKFASIAIQFVQRDVAVAAALQAAEKAVGAQNIANTQAISKSEVGTAKQMDELSRLIQTMTGTLDSKISDIKDRVAAVENKAIGGSEQRETRRSDQGSLVQVVSTIIAMVAIVVSVVAVFASGHVASPPVYSVSPSK